MPPARSKTRSKALRLAVGVTTSALVLGLAELGARLALGPPPPPVPVFTAVAEQDRYFEVKDGLVRPTYQFQNPIPPFAATSDEPRVAFLGGSSVHGGVRTLPTDKEFPALVQRLTGIETINLANPALDSHDTVRIVEELIALDFDALVIYDGHNDFGNIYFNQRYVGAASVRARAEEVLGHLRMFHTLRDTLRPPAAASRRVDDATGTVTTQQRELALAGFEANLRRVAWIAREHGLDVIVGTPVSCLAIAPDGPTCVEEPCATDLWRQAQGARTSGADPAQVAELYEHARDVDPIPLRAPRAAIQVVRRVAREEELSLVDVVTDFPRDAGAGIPDCGYLADNVHFSESGHRVMAAIFAPTVKRVVTGVATP